MGSTLVNIFLAIFVCSLLVEVTHSARGNAGEERGDDLRAWLAQYESDTIAEHAAMANPDEEQPDPEPEGQELTEVIDQRGRSRDQTGGYSRVVRKCCKVGRRVAKKGLYCSVDMFLPEKRNNAAYKRKMKFEGPDIAMNSRYRRVMEKVEKCSMNRADEAMFTKCCDHQSDVERQLFDCKTLPSFAERRQCRQHVRSEQ